MSEPQIKIEIVEGDVLTFSADVLALKYAQHFYGSDAAVAEFLVVRGVVPENQLKPAPGSYVWVDTEKVLLSSHLLLVGVPRLLDFGYFQIEAFTFDVMRHTAQAFPAEVAHQTLHLAMTLHGPGYGLDEVEALHAVLRGIFAGIDWGATVGRVSILERDAARVGRLHAVLAKLQARWRSGARLLVPLPGRGRQDSTRAPRRGRHSHAHAPEAQSVESDLTKPIQPDNEAESYSAAELGLPSAEQVERKPRAFVAMPFVPEMEDVFYYGIQNPVRQLGYICERVGQEAFTGDILEQVKMRIENAEIVIADLTGANANVYLEVGYAWGKGRPTLLVANKKDDLRFDVRGQRCLKYQSIKDLEKQLTSELESLERSRRK